MAYLSDTIIYGDLGIKGVLDSTSGANFAGDITSNTKKVVLSDGTNASGTWGITATSANKVNKAISFTYGDSSTNNALLSFDGSVARSVKFQSDGDVLMSFSNNVFNIGVSGFATNHTHLNSIYLNCATASATTAKVITLANFKLISSCIVNVNFTAGSNVANPTLNINGTGAKNIRYKGANLTTSYPLVANKIYSLIYDGTYYNILGEVEPYFGVAKSTSALYKIAIDNSGRITSATASTASDISAGTVSINGANGTNNHYLTSVNNISSGQTLRAFTGLYATSNASTLIENTTNYTQGTSTLVLGNNLASTANGNYMGKLNMFGTSTGYSSIVPTNNTTSNITINLPSTSSNLAYKSSANTFTANQVILADGTSGGIKTSGYTIATSVPSGAIFTDTKNTAGSTNDTAKLYLIGAKSQSANVQTYSNSKVYIEDSSLYVDNDKLVTATELSTAMSSAMVYKGTIGTTGTLKDLPTKDVKSGDTYRIIEGFEKEINNTKVEVGDMVIAISSGDNVSWSVIQNNLDSSSIVNSGDAINRLKSTSANTIFYGNSSKGISELAFSGANKFLMSNGTTSAPSWGDAYKVVNTVTTTGTIYLTGTTSSSTNTDSHKFYNSVYVNGGNLTANSFISNTINGKNASGTTANTSTTLTISGGQSMGTGSANIIFNSYTPSTTSGTTLNTTAVEVMRITPTNVTFSKPLACGANGITTTGAVSVGSLTSNLASIAISKPLACGTNGITTTGTISGGTFQSNNIRGVNASGTTVDTSTNLTISGGQSMGKGSANIIFNSYTSSTTSSTTLNTTAVEVMRITPTNVTFSKPLACGGNNISTSGAIDAGSIFTNTIYSKNASTTVADSPTNLSISGGKSTGKGVSSISLSVFTPSTTSSTTLNSTAVEVMKLNSTNVTFSKPLACGANSITTTGAVSVGSLTSSASSITISKPLACGANSITTKGAVNSSSSNMDVINCSTDANLRNVYIQDIDNTTNHTKRTFLRTINDETYAQTIIQGCNNNHAVRLYDSFTTGVSTSDKVQGKEYARIFGGYTSHAYLQVNRRSSTDNTILSKGYYGSNKLEIVNNDTVSATLNSSTGANVSVDLFRTSNGANSYRMSNESGTFYIKQSANASASTPTWKTSLTIAYASNDASHVITSYASTFHSKGTVKSDKGFEYGTDAKMVYNSTTKSIQFIFN